MKIYTPVKGATGVWCSVYFQNGVGETKNPHLIEWFRNHGYRIEGDEVKPVVDVADATPDFDAMTFTELKKWANANGYGDKIKNIKSKSKLLEVIKG
jgi:hypothetical protein